MSRRVALSAKRVSTTSLSIPKWDDTRVSPFAPFLNPHARASNSHHWHCFIAFICFISPLSLYFLIGIEIGERAGSIRSPISSSSANRDDDGDGEASICSSPRDGRGLQLRNAFTDEIVRPSVMLAASFASLPPPFPPAATKRLGSPSLLCPSFPLFSASVFRLLAPNHQRPSPPPPPPFDCPRDKNRAPLFACSAAM